MWSRADSQAQIVTQWENIKHNSKLKVRVVSFDLCVACAILRLLAVVQSTGAEVDAKNVIIPHNADCYKIFVPIFIEHLFSR